MCRQPLVRVTSAAAAGLAMLGTVLTQPPSIKGTTNATERKEARVHRTWWCPARLCSFLQTSRWQAAGANGRPWKSRGGLVRWHDAPGSQPPCCDALRTPAGSRAMAACASVPLSATSGRSSTPGPGGRSFKEAPEPGREASLFSVASHRRLAFIRPHRPSPSLVCASNALT